MPTVMITGGTGLIGKNLTRHLITKGYEVIIVSRNPPRNTDNPMINFLSWNIEEEKIDTDAIIKSDYIINLAGAGVMKKKWTKKYKKEIVDSRTKGSRLVISALSANENQVKAIISASATGWYPLTPVLSTSGEGASRNSFIEEDTPCNDFLGETCRLWEESIEPAKQLNKRLVKLRTGIVLSRDGGALAKFKKPLQFGIASIFGSGRQMISWIHIDDLCRMYIYAIENERLSGSYNAVAPEPVNNKNLILKLADTIRGQFYIPLHVPKILIKLILGERSTEALKSAVVSCQKIKAAGFTFLYPTIDAALKELESDNTGKPDL